MKINFDNINASVEKLQSAVDSANQKIAELTAQVGAGAEDQARVDAIAATVSAEAEKLRPSDGGPSTGGITA